MGVRIDVIGATTTTQGTVPPASRVVINVNSRPAVSTSSSSQSILIEVLKGAKGDQNVYAGPVAPENPQEGWIWIDTSA
jgi:hypothetical protein